MNKKLFYLVILALLIQVTTNTAKAQDLNQQLIEAAKNNDLGQIKELIKNDADVNAQDENGATVLMWAVYGGDIETVKYLVSKKADFRQKGVIYINKEKTSYYGNLLSIAVSKDKFEILKFLLEECKIDIEDGEYNPETEKSDGWTALQWAVYEQNSKIEKYLIGKGANEENCYEQKAFQFFNKNEYKKAAIMFEKAVPVKSKKTGKNSEYAKTLLYTAVCFDRSKNYEKAQKYYLSSYVVYKSINDIKNPMYAIACYNLALSYHTFGNYSQAELFYIKAKNIYQNVSGKEHADYAASCHNLARLYDDLGNYSRAEVLYVESKNTREKVLGKEHYDYASSCARLGGLYYALGNYAQAESLYIEAQYFSGKVLGKKNMVYATNCYNLAELYRNLGNYQKAEPLFIEAQKIYMKIQGNEELYYAVGYNNLAEIYRRFENNGKSESLHIKARSIREKILGKEHPDYATSCYNLANLYRLMRKTKKAESLCVEAKQIQEKVLGKEHTDYAATCNLLAVLNFEKGNYKKADSLYIKARKIYKKVFGKKHLDYALCCDNYGVLKQEVGKSAGTYIEKMSAFQDALPFYTEAKQIRGKVLGKDHYDYLATSVSLADLYYDMGNYSHAEPLYLDVKNTYGKKYGQNHPDYIFSCTSLSKLYTEMGNSAKTIKERADAYQKAESFYIEAKEIIENVYGKQHEYYVGSCNKLAGFYQLKGNYQKAEPLYLEAKTIDEKVYGKGHPYYATSCNNLADLYFDMGSYRQAETLYLEAKRILEKLYGKQGQKYAASCNNLGELYKTLGNYQQAELLFIEAKKIKKNIFGKYHISNANSYNNLATLYHTMGNYQKAETFYIESKNIYEIVLGKNHADYAVSCNNLAELYRVKAYSVKPLKERMNMYQQAELLYIDAKKAREIALGKQHPDYAMSCNNLASLYMTMENYTKAEPLYVEAKEIREKFLGKDHPSYAVSCNNLAELYRSLGNYKKAETFYIEASKIFGKVFEKNNPSYARSCTNLAILYQNMGVNPKADSLYVEANSIINFLLKESAKFMSEKERENYLMAEINFMFEIFHSFFLANKKKRGNYTGIVFNNALNIKGQLLQSAIAIRKAVIQGGDTTLISIYNKMNNYGKILAKQYTLPPEKRRPDIKQLEEKVNFLEKELTRLTQNLQSLQDLVGFNIRWTDIQKFLKKDETAIEFIHFDYYDGKKWNNTPLYYALVLRKDYVYPKAVFLFEEKQLQKLLKLKQNEDDFAYVKRLYSPSSAESDSLYKMVFKPLETYLTGTKTIYISPTGLLNRIAFDALTCDSLSTLSDKYNVFYTSSTVTSINKTGLFPKDIKNAALFGGIEYDITPQKMLVNSNVFNKGSDPAGFQNPQGLSDLQSFTNLVSLKRNLDSLTRHVSWNYLPGSLKETESIQDVLNKKNIGVKLYKDEQGSEEQFKALENSAPSILHVSTHGFYFGDDNKSNEYKDMIDKKVKFAHSENPLLRSGFILAGGNAAFQGKNLPDGVEDGVLTAAEISRLNFFKTKLVVLSACQTGLGDVKGNEGVYGLQRAFKMAGVDYLLFSLWEVPDYQTRELMTNFYKNWFTGMEIRVAFKKAQNQLKTKYAKVEGAAFAWAAFVLMK